MKITVKGYRVAEEGRCIGEAHPVEFSDEAVTGDIVVTVMDYDSPVSYTISKNEWEKLITFGRAFLMPILPAKEV